MILKSDAKFEEKLACCWNLMYVDPSTRKSQHSKVSNICTLIGPFREKYITFNLRKYRGVIFHDTEESRKI